LGRYSERIATIGLTRATRGCDFGLVDREMLIGVLTARQCQLVSEWTRSLPGEKAFWMGIFRR
jgi:hypothetical protein